MQYTATIEYICIPLAGEVKARVLPGGPSANLPSNWATITKLNSYCTSVSRLTSKARLAGSAAMSAMRLLPLLVQKLLVVLPSPTYTGLYELRLEKCMKG